VSPVSRRGTPRGSWELGKAPGGGRGALDSRNEEGPRTSLGLRGSAPPLSHTFVPAVRGPLTGPSAARAIVDGQGFVQEPTRPSREVDPDNVSRRHCSIALLPRHLSPRPPGADAGDGQDAPPPRGGGPGGYQRPAGTDTSPAFPTTLRAGCKSGMSATNPCTVPIPSVYLLLTSSVVPSPQTRDRLFVISVSFESVPRKSLAVGDDFPKNPLLPKNSQRSLPKPPSLLHRFPSVFCICFSCSRF